MQRHRECWLVGRSLVIGLMLMSAGVCLAAPPAAGNKPTAKPRSRKLNRKQLEQAFARKLTGAVLVGRFSIVGHAKGNARPDRYEIETARKGQGDEWDILARVKFAQYDVRVPVRIKVLWAGDTPVMSLTNLTIPVLGTFTARVMFYGNRYAGTWQHGKAGGHMWGTIERAKPKGKTPTKNKPADGKTSR